MKTKNCLNILLACILLLGCKQDDENPTPTSTIIYKKDGRNVGVASPLPLTIDITGDGQMDFTIFMELTAGSQGDRLYAGINPLGPNLIKSGPPNDTNFLNMGLLVAEAPGSSIDLDLETEEQWTSEFGALAIRNTFSNGTITYEGNWAHSKQMVGFQHTLDGSVYFGWIQIEFNKNTEMVTLIDYAYQTIASKPIIAGQK